jgi:hypothetical protein
MGSFTAQECQGEIDTFDFTAPAFLDRAVPTGEQVFFELVEPRQHLGIYRQHRATDASVLVGAWGSIWPSARSKFDAPLVEMLFKLRHFVIVSMCGFRRSFCQCAVSGDLLRFRSKTCLTLAAQHMLDGVRMWFQVRAFGGVGIP